MGTAEHISYILRNIYIAMISYRQSSLNCIDKSPVEKFMLISANIFFTPSNSII